MFLAGHAGGSKIWLSNVTHMAIKTFGRRYVSGTDRAKTYVPGYMNTVVYSSTQAWQIFSIIFSPGEKRRAREHNAVLHILLLTKQVVS